ncbi:hypothetical protein [Thalassotalea marina]|uniref:Uncharacterized protein n=1 Tax=Thalassotalea marina TaxID=1673741 RepID=A0A919EH90_9GAMM|nr:hypothetical protein [Thalassotalea marina]GHF78144.1 hypothetical protein GCM10017161_01480 [Thalassotalea marina]
MAVDKRIKKHGFSFIEATGLMVGLVILWFVSFLFFVCLYLSHSMFSTESGSSLFQRAGGLVVVLAVFIEYGVLNLINRWLDKNNNCASGKTYRKVSFVMHARLSCKMAIFITVIAGTIIWAYGDLVYLKYF